MRTSFVLGRTGVALLLCAAVLAVSAPGCSRVRSRATGPMVKSQLASGTTDASSAASAPAAPRGTTPKKTDGSSKPAERKPLSDSDAKAIDAELSAIQKELDNMALPSDSDFGGIESGLE